MVRTTRKHAFVSENKQSRLPDSLCRRTRCTSRHFFTRHRHVHVFVSADAFHRLDAHSPRPRVVRKAPTTRHRASTPVLAVLAGDAFASEFQSLLHDTAAQTDTFFVFDYTGSEYRPPGRRRVAFTAVASIRAVTRCGIVRGRMMLATRNRTSSWTTWPPRYPLPPTVSGSSRV